MRTLIKHGLIVDPASHVHSKNNLLVEDGRIQGLTAEDCGKPWYLEKAAFGL